MRAKSLLAAAAVFAIAVPLRAQASDSASAAELRSDCRFAEQILTTGHPSPHYGWALDFISHCSETGGATLAGLWRSPPDSEGDLQRLFVASYSLRDAQILDTASLAARNGSLPIAVRAVALRLLAAYADPTLLLSDRDLAPTQGRRVLGGNVDHVVTRDGSHPLPTDIRIRIVSMPKALASAEGDTRVARAAAEIVRRLHN